MRFELFVALRYLKAKCNGKLARVWVRQETTGERGDGRLNAGKRLGSFSGFEASWAAGRARFEIAEI